MTPQELRQEHDRNANEFTLQLEELSSTRRWTTSLSETDQKEQGWRNKTGALQADHPRPFRLCQKLETDFLPAEMRQRANTDRTASTRTEDPELDQSDDRVKRSD